MSKLYAMLDENNPAHQVVIGLNKKNEELYGPYHEECGTYEEYCTCKKEIDVNDLSQTDKDVYAEIENLIIYWSNDGTKTAGTLTRRIMYVLEQNKNI